MKNHKLHKIAALLLLFAAAASQIVGASKSSARLKRDAAKADYIFMEALRYSADDSLDAYSDLISRAYELNPADDYIAGEYGRFLLYVSYPDDMDRVNQGLGLMRKYVERNPSDYMSGIRLGRIFNQLNRNDDALQVYKLVYEKNEDPRITGGAYASALAYTYNHDSIYKALRVMDRIESYAGLTPDISATKMRFYSLLNDTAAVIGEARRLLDKSPRAVPFNVMFAELNMGFGRLDTALTYYNRAVELDPTSGYARYSRAQYYQSIGDTVARDRDIFEAMHYPDLDVESKLGILGEFVGELYADSTQHDRLNSLFIDLVKQYPHQEALRQMYGSYLYQTGDKEGAAEQFGYLLSLDPNNLDFWTSLVQLYYMMEQYDKAESTLADALRYFPADTRLYLIGSSIALVQEDLDGARHYVNTALKMGGDTISTVLQAELYGALGDIDYRSENLDSAWSNYNRALQFDPENSMLLNNVAYYMACEERDIETARQYIEKALSLEKTNKGEQSTTTLDTYAWVLFKQRDYAKALEIINQVLELEEEQSSGDVLDHAGDIYFMNGKPKEALEFWKQALEDDPDNELIQKKVKNKTFFFE